MLTLPKTYPASDALKVAQPLHAAGDAKAPAVKDWLY
jgi:hypothetical protein